MHIVLMMKCFPPPPELCSPPHFSHNVVEVEDSELPHVCVAGGKHGQALCKILLLRQLLTPMATQLHYHHTVTTMREICQLSHCGDITDLKAV